MEISRKWRFSWCLLLGLTLLATTLQNVQGEEESEAPSQCKPYIEKALKEQQKDDVSSEPPDQQDVDEASADTPTDDSEHDASAGEDDSEIGDEAADAESTETEQGDAAEVSAEDEQTQADDASTEKEEETGESKEGEASHEEVETPEEEEMQGDQPADSAEGEAEEGKSEEADAKSDEADAEEAGTESAEEAGIQQSSEAAEGEAAESEEAAGDAESQEAESSKEQAESAEDAPASAEEGQESAAESAEEQADAAGEPAESVEDAKSGEASTEADAEAEAAGSEQKESAEAGDEQSAEGDGKESAEDAGKESAEDGGKESAEEGDKESAEDAGKESVEEGDKESAEDVGKESAEDTTEVKSAKADVDESAEVKKEVSETEGAAESAETKEDAEESKEGGEESKEGADDSKEGEKSAEEAGEEGEAAEEASKEAGEAEEGEESKEAVPEEDLIQEIEIPDNLRPREHIDQLLKLDDSHSQAEAVLNKVSEITLKELKKLYENAIKPLETLYKYRDLSNRHFGDSEIFSKPLVVFMGPWSGGKSSIINYLVDNEYNITSLRTGAEPSPAYFNLLMYGDEPEVLDGTQLAADFTFAGLQKFGQGLEERLRGLKLPNKLLEKMNIVEIPGILEVRKQVSRVFPFNDACQWFIDRADIIFLVYDPSKLDVGPETEAILDQLKGREHQTRIVLNKADQVKPEELMRVQSALIWNISPLMSSAQPPVMYTTSLWSRPYETWAPVRLLQAQERAFLRDLRTAVDKRIENKISSARRFAVRVRNHAKMVDCYLTTYYNHKSVFGNRKQVSDQIIEHPQDYHIYEGLSTLTNISRYDLPDPDVYRDFFRLNPLYDFQQLSATCTYFRGCPINRLDVAIAYDLPELVGKHKKLVEGALAEVKPADNS